jgi:DNA-binding transcriptional LysR family regulator
MSIEVADVLSSRQSEALLAHHIDVGFSWHIERSSHLICEPILRARFAACVSENDALARRKTLPLKELSGKPVILLGPPRKLQTIYDKILALYASAGIAPNIITTSDEYSVDNLVASGKGIFFTFLNPLIQDYNKSGIAVVPLSDAEATLDVQLGWRRNETSGAVLRFVDFVCKVFGLPKRKEAHRKEAPRSIVRRAI